MKKYIDAVRLKKFLAERYKVCPISDDERHGRHCAIIEVENFIASLQQEQPEVDLEKEIKAEWDVIDTDLLRFEEFKAICYSFYELGINARKEE